MKNSANLYAINKIFSKHNIFLSIGFILLLWYLWSRIFRERLPQNIPFSLSFCTLILLLFICIRYLYVVYRIFYPPQDNTLWRYVFENIKTYGQIILTILDNFLRTNKYTNAVLYFLSHLILYTLDIHAGYKRDLFIYLSCIITPKIIWLSCLIIDCVFYKQLNLTYLYSIIMIIPLISRYTSYYVQMSALEHVVFLNKWFLIEITSKDIIYKPEDYDEEGFLKHNVPRYYTDPSDIEYDHITFSLNNIKSYYYVTPSNFINLQGGAITWQYNLYTYNILYIYEQQDNILLNKNPFSCPMTKTQCNTLLWFYAKGNAFDKHIQASLKHYKTEVNTITVIVNLLFFFCWSYILVVSLPNAMWNDILSIIYGAKPYEILGEFSVFPWYNYSLDIQDE